MNPEITHFSDRVHCDTSFVTKHCIIHFSLLWHTIFIFSLLVPFVLCSSSFFFAVFKATKIEMEATSDRPGKKRPTLESDSDGSGEDEGEENGRVDEDDDGDGVTIVFRPKSGSERVKEHYQWMRESVFHGDILSRKVEGEKEKDESVRSEKEEEKDRLDWKTLLKEKMKRELPRENIHSAPLIGSKRKRNGPPSTYFQSQKEKEREVEHALENDDAVEDAHFFNSSEIVETTHSHVVPPTTKEKSPTSSGDQDKQNWLEKTLLLRGQLCKGRGRDRKRTTKASSKTRSEGPIEHQFASALRDVDVVIPSEMDGDGAMWVEFNVINLRKENGVCLCTCSVDSISEQSKEHFPELILGETIDLVLRSSDELKLGIIPGGSLKIDGDVEICINSILPHPLLWTSKHLSQ
jgi:hypothetical protein